MVGIAVIILVVIVVGAVGAFVLSDQGLLDLDFQLGQFTGGFIETMVGDIEETPVLLGTQNYDGNLGVTFLAESVLTTQFQTTLSGVFQYETVCYERIGDTFFDWEILDFGGNANFDEQQTIKIRKSTANDVGLTEMWCSVDRTGGDTYLVDVDGIIKANTRIDTCIFEDPDFDNTDGWICRVNLLDVSATDPKIPPTINIRLKFWKEAFTSNLGCSGCPAFINQESNHDNFRSIDNILKFDSDYLVGQGESGISSGFVKALTQVQITTQGACASIGCGAGDPFTGDQLEENYDINDSFIEVPFGNGIQTIKLSDMESLLFEDKIVYKWMYDKATGRRDVAGANVIILDVQEDRIIDFPVVIQTTFDAGSQEQNLCVQLELEYVDSFGTFTTTENTIEIVAQSSNTQNCIIDVQD